MNKKTFVRFLLISLGCSVLLWMVTLFSIRAFNENSNLEPRRHLALSLAAVFESGSYPEAIEKYSTSRPGRPGFRVKVWILGAEGKVLASNATGDAPPAWNGMPKPENVHDIDLGYRWFALNPSYTVIRLVGVEQPIYLVFAPQRDGHAAQRNLVQFILFSSALALSTFLSLLITFYYLRKKSREAREIILRLESGDLKARFQIKQFDEIGNLMLDFNRMASEIERLVGKLKESEEARRVLFQELSHDLRTPLTSLRTSIDMLAIHGDQVSAKDREEALKICQTEISYFVELIESLLFIAQMEEPKYKKRTEVVDLASIVEGEVKAMAVASPLKWQCRVPSEGASLPGDAHQIRRLIRNALENASRYAAHEVRVNLSARDSLFILEFIDDGPGMSAEELAEFGRSRNRRLKEGREGAHLSLGLGSVIMRKIVELHEGYLSVHSRENSDSGTRLEIQLRRQIGN